MRVLIVDDHAIVRAGLSRLLAGEAVGEAQDARGALAAVRAGPYDLVLLDMNLPDGGGLDLIRRLTREAPGLRILVLSMHADPLYASRALEAGARGYMSKGASPDEILTAVRTIVGGGRYIEGQIAQAIALRETLDGPRAGLSSRELEILRLLAEGRSLHEIADRLGVAYKTVANGASQLKTKLGAASTADLVRLALNFAAPDLAGTAGSRI